MSRLNTDQIGSRSGEKLEFIFNIRGIESNPLTLTKARAEALQALADEYIKARKHDQPGTV